MVVRRHCAGCYVESFPCDQYGCLDIVPEIFSFFFAMVDDCSIPEINAYTARPRILAIPPGPLPAQRCCRGGSAPSLLSAGGVAGGVKGAAFYLRRISGSA